MIKLIVGIQWGDEGKGRIAHFESRDANMVVRSTGGNNAGHTVVANGKRFAMHLLPSSIIRNDVKSIMGPAVVIDPEVLQNEISKMEEVGIPITPEKLFISDRAHIILKHHKQLDALYEGLKLKKVGTTKRGIGPTYAGKCNRTNIRMGDLNSPDLDERLTEALLTANALFEKFGYPIISIEEEKELLNKARLNLSKFLTDSQHIIFDAYKNNQVILVEGAQALYLDLDHGDYPFVTSSSPNASGTASGAGIGPTKVDEVIGVMKAYCSRVGEGPFTTELTNEIGDKIRELGHEYGTTTKRPRRCGWLDLVMIKNAGFINGLTSLALNHVDTIGNLPMIKVCIGYKYNNSTIDYIPLDRQNCEPVYKEFVGGWDTKGCTSYEDLPSAAKNYIDFIENYTGIKIKYIGVGPDEHETIVNA